MFLYPFFSKSPTGISKTQAMTRAYLWGREPSFLEVVDTKERDKVLPYGITHIMKRPREREFYKVYSIRLKPETMEKLKKEKEKGGKSWNIFLFNLLNAYYANEREESKSNKS